MPRSLTVHESLIWVMVTTSAADRDLKDVEIGQFEALIRRLPIFEGFAGNLAKIAEDCVAYLKDQDGITHILAAVAEALPPRLYETAYALAVEIAAADFFVRQEELVFLQMLEDHLEIDKLAVAAIEHSARVRYRKAR